MKNKLKFYEVELWRIFEGECVTDYSLCIKGVRMPNYKEAQDFLKKDIEGLGYSGVTRVFEISEKEAYDFFDTENIDNWPIFGKENEQMKNEKRIIDKAITSVKNLISLLDGDLRVANLKLSQEFDDNISDLLALEDQLYDIVNNFYNPSQKPEYAIVGYEKDKNHLYEELYFSSDIQDVLKKLNT